MPPVRLEGTRRPGERGCAGAYRRAYATGLAEDEGNAGDSSSESLFKTQSSRETDFEAALQLARKAAEAGSANGQTILCFGGCDRGLQSRSLFCRGSRGPQGRGTGGEMDEARCRRHGACAVHVCGHASGWTRRIGRACLLSSQTRWTTHKAIAQRGALKALRRLVLNC